MSACLQGAGGNDDVQQWNEGDCQAVGTAQQHQINHERAAEHWELRSISFIYHQYHQQLQQHLAVSHALSQTEGFDQKQNTALRSRACLDSAQHITVFSVRCNIYISRLCYDVGVYLSVTEVPWRIIANLGFKFRSHFTTHCGRCAACGRRAAFVRIISRHASQC